MFSSGFSVNRCWQAYFIVEKGDKLWCREVFDDSSIYLTSTILVALKQKVLSGLCGSCTDPAALASHSTLLKGLISVEPPPHYHHHHH